MPLWSVYPQWGWITEDAARALAYLKRFGSVTVAEVTYVPGKHPLAVVDSTLG